ncbi:hypothetical protein JKP88DRAFT_327255 [Tribonema minus]|uniref:SGF29 C-terminal domain-containing protein n=1 Tax=Tribonema minus TaxID=303371 RepID=A0A835YQP7_9STRA|nr:hypothetical protein JKP88DRAFT_327255 [Tribonema minus]
MSDADEDEFEEEGEEEDEEADDAWTLPSLAQPTMPKKTTTVGASCGTCGSTKSYTTPEGEVYCEDCGARFELIGNEQMELGLEEWGGIRSRKIRVVRGAAADRASTHVATAAALRAFQATAAALLRALSAAAGLRDAAPLLHVARNLWAAYLAAWSARSRYPLQAAFYAGSGMTPRTQRRGWPGEGSEGQEGEREGSEGEGEGEGSKGEGEGEGEGSQGEGDGEGSEGEGEKDRKAPAVLLNGAKKAAARSKGQLSSGKRKKPKDRAEASDDDEPRRKPDAKAPPAAAQPLKRKKPPAATTAATASKSKLPPLLRGSGARKRPAPAAADKASAAAAAAEPRMKPKQRHRAAGDVKIGDVPEEEGGGFVLGSGTIRVAPRRSERAVPTRQGTHGNRAYVARVAAAKRAKAAKDGRQQGKQRRRRARGAEQTPSELQTPSTLVRPTRRRARGAEQMPSELVHPTMELAAALTYLAARWLRLGVLPIDVARWCRDGTLPYINAYERLPSALRDAVRPIRTFFRPQNAPTAAQAVRPIRTFFWPQNAPTANQIMFLAERFAMAAGADMPPLNAHLVGARLAQALGLPQTVLDTYNALIEAAVPVPPPKHFKNKREWHTASGAEMRAQHVEKARAVKALPEFLGGFLAHASPAHLMALLVVASKLSPRWQRWLYERGGRVQGATAAAAAPGAAVSIHTHLRRRSFDTTALGNLHAYLRTLGYAAAPPPRDCSVAPPPLVPQTDAAAPRDCAAAPPTPVPQTGAEALLLPRRDLAAYLRYAEGVELAATIEGSDFASQPSPDAAAEGVRQSVQRMLYGLEDPSLATADPLDREEQHLTTHEGLYLVYGTPDFIHPMHSHYTLLVEACAHHLEVNPEDVHRLVMKFDANLMKLDSHDAVMKFDANLMKLVCGPTGPAERPTYFDVTEYEDRRRVKLPRFVWPKPHVSELRRLGLRRAEALEQRLSEHLHDSSSDQHRSNGLERHNGGGGDLCGSSGGSGGGSSGGSGGGASRAQQQKAPRRAHKWQRQREHHRSSGAFDGNGNGSGAGGTAVNSGKHRSGSSSSSSTGSRGGASNDDSGKSTSGSDGSDGESSGVGERSQLQRQQQQQQQQQRQQSDSAASDDSSGSGSDSRAESDAGGSDIPMRQIEFGQQQKHKQQLALLQQSAESGFSGGASTDGSDAGSGPYAPYHRDASYNTGGIDFRQLKVDEGAAIDRVIERSQEEHAAEMEEAAQDAADKSMESCDGTTSGDDTTTSTSTRTTFARAPTRRVPRSEAAKQTGFKKAIKSRCGQGISKPATRFKDVNAKPKKTVSVTALNKVDATKATTLSAGPPKPTTTTTRSSCVHTGDQGAMLQIADASEQDQDGDNWILAVVEQCHADADLFICVDEDEKDKKDDTKTKFNRRSDQIVRLKDTSAGFTKKQEVLAVYPGSTVFYKAKFERTTGGVDEMGNYCARMDQDVLAMYPSVTFDSDYPNSKGNVRAKNIKPRYVIPVPPQHHGSGASTSNDTAAADIDPTIKEGSGAAATSSEAYAAPVIESIAAAEVKTCGKRSRSESTVTLSDVTDIDSGCSTPCASPVSSTGKNNPIRPNKRQRSNTQDVFNIAAAAAAAATDEGSIAAAAAQEDQPAAAAASTAAAPTASAGAAGNWRSPSDEGINLVISAIEGLAGLQAEKKARCARVAADAALSAIADAAASAAPAAAVAPAAAAAAAAAAASLVSTGKRRRSESPCSEEGADDVHHSAVEGLANLLIRRNAELAAAEAAATLASIAEAAAAPAMDAAAAAAAVPTAAPAAAAAAAAAAAVPAAAAAAAAPPLGGGGSGNGPAEKRAKVSAAAVQCNSAQAGAPPAPIVRSVRRSERLRSVAQQCTNAQVGNPVLPTVEASKRGTKRTRSATAEVDDGEVASTGIETRSKRTRRMAAAGARRLRQLES